MKTLMLIATILLLSNCATKGFNRGELRKQIGITKPVVTDSDIKEALNKKPNLPKPFKLAVYFSNPKQLGKSMSHWQWRQDDRDLIFKINEELKKQNLVAQVFPIAGTLVQSDDLKSIRLAAAQHNADAVLIISGISDVQRFANNWSWSYALILPTFFIHGSEVDGLFMSTASMWDVRNEYLYLTAEAEGSYAESYPAALGKNDKEVFDIAKEKSLQKLKQQIVKMIQGQSS